MTLIEAINMVDALKPNVYTQSDKVKWISNLDGMIKSKIIDTHEGGEDIAYESYTDDTPLDTRLLVNAPYEEIYVAWLEAKIDYANGEYARYNNSVIRYNDLYTAFQNEYNRTHMPKGSAIRYF